MVRGGYPLPYPPLAQLPQVLGTRRISSTCLCNTIVIIIHIPQDDDKSKNSRYCRCLYLTRSMTAAYQLINSRSQVQRTLQKATCKCVLHCSNYLNCHSVSRTGWTQSPHFYPKNVKKTAVYTQVNVE